VLNLKIKHVVYYLNIERKKGREKERERERETKNELAINSIMISRGRKDERMKKKR